MIEYELDIPSLTEHGILLGGAFWKVRELTSSSKIEWLIMIEMLILLIDSFEERFIVNREMLNY